MNITKQARNDTMWRAHTAVWQAVKEGILIKPSACELCEKDSPVVAHHTDYTKQLEVVWLCDFCHRRIHCLVLPFEIQGKVLKGVLLAKARYGKAKLLEVQSETIEENIRWHDAQIVLSSLESAKVKGG